MSIKVTRKELQETFVCVGCGYCKAEDITTFIPRIFYNYGVYGWNFDGYILKHSQKNRILCLTTGYRNVIHNEVVKDDYLIIEKYDKLARQKIDSQHFSREENQILVNNLIDEFYGKFYEYYGG